MMEQQQSPPQQPKRGRPKKLTDIEAREHILKSKRDYQKKIFAAYQLQNSKKNTI
jgi:hypothetical protein